VTKVVVFKGKKLAMGGVGGLLASESGFGWASGGGMCGFAQQQV
jgi:hypothetical protein